MSEVVNLCHDRAFVTFCYVHVVKPLGSNDIMKVVMKVGTVPSEITIFTNEYYGIQGL